jgi:hypothetical protein
MARLVLGHPTELVASKGFVLVKLGEPVLPMLCVLVTSDLARHEDIFLLVTQLEEKVYSTHLDFHA